MESELPIPKDRRKGRAATANRAGRFERHQSFPIDDGWSQDPLPPLRTEVHEDLPRKIITRNSSPDVPFDRSVNPYRGCEHGCIYCFARPSHAYLNLSPGLDFETRLLARPSAPQKLANELSHPAYRPQTLAIGTNTDPYQPIEAQRRIMAGLLDVLHVFRHPVSIVTKGTLIERDLDVLSEMQGLVHVGVSLTTLDPDLSRRMEPRVPAPARRLRTIETLAQAGIPVRVMVSPIVPGLSDHELEAILSAAASAGAQAASSIPLRLPGEVAPLFWDWLQVHYPDRVAKIQRRMRELNGGKEYDAGFGRRMTGQGPWARLMRARFDASLRRLGLSSELLPLRTDLFRVPPRPGDQLSLF